MEDKIYTLRRFYGLRECPDGDTKLKFGEAAECENFAVTRDGNLRRRAGTKSLCKLGEGPVRGIWSGRIRGYEKLVSACGGKLFELSYNRKGLINKTEIGSLIDDTPTHFFGFSNILYILTGNHYFSYDGKSLKEVEGYVPLVAITVKNDGTFETLERINLLSPKRRAWLSPDGKNSGFKLPEQNIKKVNYVKNLNTGEIYTWDMWSCDLKSGLLNFRGCPTEGVNTIEVCWSAEKDFREKICKMRYSELFNGAQDTRVFLYGDGSNKLYYSGLSYEGAGRADYFPDMNEVKLGDENTAVTALIRHYSTLLCYKTDSLWGIRAGETELAMGDKTAVYYCTPLNRSLGNEAPGQVQMVLNWPFSLCGRDLFKWESSAGIYPGSVELQRSAKRISDRIYKSLGEFDFKNCVCFNDSAAQEYYISCGNCCLVYNYASDAWYKYSGLNIKVFCRNHQRLLLGDESGNLLELSYRYNNDDGRPIIAYFESGSMAFLKEQRRKLAGEVWIGIKPESRGEIYIDCETDRGGSGGEKKIVSSLASLSSADFNHWSFCTNRRPKIHKVKLKAKKFVYYKLIIRSRSAHSSGTVLASGLRIRFTGLAK